MPYPLIIASKTVYFRREGAGCSQTAKPTFSNADWLGTAAEISWSAEREPVVHERTINGIWVDYEMLPLRDRQIITVTFSELSEIAWELLFGTAVALAGGSGTFTPGDSVSGNGWLKIEGLSTKNTPAFTFETWAHAEIDSLDFPRDNLVNVPIRFRKLYSTLNTGSLDNVA